jgi:glycosyltransferase involved in cell wall biosynthesis
MNTKVLHIINGEFYAGAERVQDLLALRLPEFGYEVGFVCLKQGIYAEKRMSRVPLFSYPMRSKLDMGVARKVAELAKRENYRLIHTHTPRAALLGRFTALLTGLPMVHHMHSPTDADTETGWRNMRNALAERLSLLRVRKLIAVSRSLEQYLLKKGYPPSRVCTVSNGVAIRDRTRMPLHDKGPITIGSVALYRPRKGLEVLLRTLALLRERGYAFRLHAVGPFETDEYHETIRKLVNELGLMDDIHWTGFTDDVGAEFSNMNIFVLPSLFGEGMPMVVLEAMATGLPVVSTRVEGIPEVVRDGQDGLLVEPGSSDALADALERFATGSVDAETMGDSGWHRQRERFSDLAMAQGVAGIYHEILG